jgi:AP endonuclease 1
LVNLAHAEPNRASQAYNAFIDDLNRCSTLGIKLYNFHPGNFSSSTRAEGIAHIAKQLNAAHKDPRSGDVVTLLETMAAGGNVIGSRFEELRDVIAMIERKDRVGVCLDTCHVFAAGYDLRTPEAYGKTMASFDDVVGLKYLLALHVNDSKAPLGSRRDLHANIGTGFLGLRSFHNLVNDERLWGLPLILETPIDKVDESGKQVEDKSIWAGEIKLMESLVGMDVESEEFRKLERELADRGEAERKRIQGQVDRRAEKESRVKTKRKKRKGAQESESERVTTEDEDSS